LLWLLCVQQLLVLLLEGVAALQQQQLVMLAAVHKVLTATSMQHGRLIGSSAVV
jgi:hypothetical protein